MTLTKNKPYSNDAACHHRRHFFLPIILQNMTAAIVLAAVAASHGPVIAAGDGLPYWLR